jgi:hypothetical protein
MAKTEESKVRVERTNQRLIKDLSDAHAMTVKLEGDIKSRVSIIAQLLL